MRKTQLQAILVIGGIGAALALIQLLGIAGGIVGVVLLILCTILTAPAAPEPDAGGLNWWALIAGGTALALIGVPLGLALEGPEACSPRSAAGWRWWASRSATP